MSLIPLPFFVQICSLMRGSIAERGGVRVGHRIIEINDESVVATSHQHIVELLATTVGEVGLLVYFFSLCFSVSCERNCFEIAQCK